MIRFTHLQLQLGEFELRIDQLVVHEGEYLVLLGPSGAGKSVILELTAGLRLLDAGRIVLAGEDVTRWAPERRRVGLVSQRPSLFPHMTVWENIRFGLRYADEQARDFEARAEELARMLHIDHLLRRGVRNLSGGEAQRVTLARALVTRPRVLLLDEPLGPLDENMRSDLAAELKRVHQRLGMTTIHVTHDQGEARDLADRVAVMAKGELMQVGPTREVFEQPENEFVARFLGANR